MNSMNKLGNGGRFTRHDLSSSSLASRTIQTAGSIYAAKKVEAGQEVKVENVTFDSRLTPEQADALTNMPFSLSGSDVNLGNGVSFTLKNSDGTTATLKADTDGNLKVNNQAVGGVPGITSSNDTLTFGTTTTVVQGDFFIGDRDVDYTLNSHGTTLENIAAANTTTSQVNNFIATGTLTIDDGIDDGNSGTFNVATKLAGHTTTLDSHTTTLDSHTTTLDGHTTTLDGHTLKLTKISYESASDPNSSSSLVTKIDGITEFHSEPKIKVDGEWRILNNEIRKLNDIHYFGGQTEIRRQLKIYGAYPLIATGPLTVDGITTLKNQLILTHTPYSTSSPCNVGNKLNNNTVLLSTHATTLGSLDQRTGANEGKLTKIAYEQVDGSMKTVMNSPVVFNDAIEIHETSGNSVTVRNVATELNSHAEKLTDITFSSSDKTQITDLTVINEFKLKPSNTAYTLSVNSSGELTLNNSVVGGSGGGGSVAGIASNSTIEMSKDVVIGTENYTKDLTVHGKLTLPQAEFGTETTTTGASTFEVTNFLPIDSTQAVTIGTGDPNNVNVTSVTIGGPFGNTNVVVGWMGNQTVTNGGAADYIYKWKHTSEDPNVCYYHMVWLTSGHQFLDGVCCRLKIFNENGVLKALAIDEVAEMRSLAYLSIWHGGTQHTNHTNGANWYNSAWVNEIDNHIGYFDRPESDGNGFYPSSIAAGDNVDHEPRYAFATSGMLGERQTYGWGIEKVTFEMTGSNVAAQGASNTVNYAKLTMNSTDWRGNVFCQLTNDDFANVAAGDNLPHIGDVSTDDINDWTIPDCWLTSSALNPYTDFFSLWDKNSTHNYGIYLKVPGYYKATCHLHATHDGNAQSPEDLGFCFQFAFNQARIGPVGVIHIPHALQVTGAVPSSGSASISHIFYYTVTSAIDSISIRVSNITSNTDPIKLFAGYSQLRVERL